MKKLAALLLCFGCLIAPANAKLLIGMIQYQEVEGKIGIKVSNQGKVHRVHPHSPAEAAGIRQGDLITNVDGKRNNVLSIHGTPGTLVCLTVKRASDTLEMNVPRVDYRQIAPD